MPHRPKGEARTFEHTDIDTIADVVNDKQGIIDHSVEKLRGNFEKIYLLTNIWSSFQDNVCLIIRTKFTILDYFTHPKFQYLNENC